MLDCLITAYDSNQEDGIVIEVVDHASTTCDASCLNRVSCTSAFRFLYCSKSSPTSSRKHATHVYWNFLLLLTCATKRALFSHEWNKISINRYGFVFKRFLAQPWSCWATSLKTHQRFAFLRSFKQTTTRRSHRHPNLTAKPTLCFLALLEGLIPGICDICFEFF